MKLSFINVICNVQGCTIYNKHCTIQFQNVVQHQTKYYIQPLSKYLTKHCILGCTMCTMFYKLSLKGCTILNQIFNQLVVQSF